MTDTEKAKSVRAEIKAAVEKRKAELEGKIQSGNGDFKVDDKLITDCLYTNEMGDGILYAVMQRDKYIYNKMAKEWLKWKGHFWDVDIMDACLADVDEVCECYLKEAGKLAERIEWAQKKQDKQYAKSLIDRQAKFYIRVNKLRTEEGRQKVLKWAQTNITKVLAITGDNTDLDPWLLACQNGVVDLRLGELRKGNQRDYILKNSPVEWDGLNTPAPAWESFLKDIFLNDQALIDYLQRLLGYAMTGLTVEHILPVLWGEQGRNGKGTMIDVIQTVLGTYAAPIQAEMLLDQGRGKSSAGPSPDIMSLRGLRIAFASETDQGRRFSTAKVKWLSGGDMLVGRSPHEKYESRFIPTHTLFMMTNNKPNAPADDNAFWERVHLIPFRVSFVRRKPQGDLERPADIYINEKLKKESSGILAWLVRGCLQWQAIGLDPPGLVTDATKEYRRDQDSLADFIEQRCVTGKGHECGSTKLYTDFRDWWADHVSKKSIPSQKTFGGWMGKKFNKTKEGTVIYFGVDLLDHMDD